MIVAGAGGRVHFERAGGVAGAELERAPAGRQQMGRRLRAAGYLRLLEPCLYVRPLLPPGAATPAVLALISYTRYRRAGILVVWPGFGGLSWLWLRSFFMFLVLAVAW